MTATHAGSCHCGAAAYEVDLDGLTDIEPFSWSAQRVDGRKF